MLPCLEISDRACFLNACSSAVDIRNKPVHRTHGPAFSKITAVDVLHESICVTEHLLRGPQSVETFAAQKIIDQGSHEMAADSKICLQPLVEITRVQRSFTECEENLADKAKKLGIPVMKFEKGA